MARKWRLLLEPVLDVAKKKPESQDSGFGIGGDKRDRTADLLHAMQALSQLSYTPVMLYLPEFWSRRTTDCVVVEISGIEPLTSCMPCKRSPS